MRTSVTEPADASSSQTVRALLRLREMILDGELPAGERISEPVVAELTGISRTPIRTALVRLQEEGLLEQIRSGGFRVRAFSVGEIRDAIEIRGTLEGLAARLAAERGVAQGDLDALTECVTRIDRVLEHGDPNEARFAEYVDANARFHNLLVACCRSDLVERQVTRAYALPFASPNGFIQVQASAPNVLQILHVANVQHRGVVEAISRREGSRAEALMREHARMQHRNLEVSLANPRVRDLIPGGRLIRDPS